MKIPSTRIKKRTLALVAKYKREILNESHSTENLQEVRIIKSSKRSTKEPERFSSHLTTSTSSAVSKVKTNSKAAPKQTTKSSAVSKRKHTLKRKALNQIVEPQEQKAKTVRGNRRGTDGTGKARAGTEAEPEVEEGQAMDLAFSRASLSEAVVDAAAEEEGVISSSEICSSIVVDGTEDARVGTEAERDIEEG